MRRNYIIKIFIYVIFSQMELGEALDSRVRSNSVLGSDF